MITGFSSRRRKCAMKELTMSRRLLRVMFGFLFIGGGAALLGIYRAAKNAELPPGYLMEENNGETFIYAAHA
jgi:hypothetical protein